MKHMLCFNKHSAIFKFFLSKLDLETVCSTLQYRRRINTEGTAKAAGIGDILEYRADHLAAWMF